jgi:predicted metal-dependent hydrolase
MSDGLSTRDFQKGAQLYAEGRYWEAHEAWEKVWRATEDPETRLMLQGLIQVCAALYKVYEKRDAAAAARLFQRAAQKLGELPDVVQNVQIASFREAATACRDVLLHDEDEGTLKRERIPRLSMLLGTLSMLALMVLASGCTSCNEHQPQPAQMPGEPPAAVTTTGSTSAGSADTGSRDGIHEDGRAYAPQSFSFVVAKTDVWIEDTKMGTNLGEVLGRTGATLAINGGFFDTDERPLGLAVSQKKVLSAFSRTMSGGVLTVDETGATLAATETFQADAHADARFAVQCRPRLVVDGKVNIKRDDGKRSARTALCVKDGGTTLVAVLVRDASDPSFGPSLFALASYLAADGCEAALNLDGGPSTGVAWRDAQGVHAEKPTAGIRHAIVFRPLAP